MNLRNRKLNKDTVCYCNFVNRQEIESAIVGGCRTLNEIFDATTAGVGPCGGSCRVYIARMLESYFNTGKFPENPRPTTKKPRKR